MSGVSGGDRDGAHAALMDRVYRRQRHIYDLTRKYYLIGRDTLIGNLGAKPGESIVEIGCGTARNLIRIAETYPGTKLYGLDASAEMLRTAKEAVSRARLSERIALRHALAEELSPALFAGVDRFDHAIFSYSLSMIPDWRRALAQAGSAVAPEGLIHVVDFGDLQGLWPPAAAALRRWLTWFHVAPRAELLALVEANAVGRADCALRLFPFRYAFVFQAGPSFVRDLAG